MEQKDSIAIVGLGGVFPGANSLDDFWELIVSGRDAAGEPPVGRWLASPDELYSRDAAAPDRVNSKRGCFVRNFHFEADGLDIPEEAKTGLDPMFHFALKAGRDALKSADLRGTDPGRIGVVFGNIALPTEGVSRWGASVRARAFAKDALGLDAFAERPNPLNRFVAGLPAGLLARALGLGGGAATLDAACASSLYAIKIAMDELVSRRADAMIAGGVSRPDSLYTQMGFSQLRAVSPSGRCSPFDAKGDGLVVGEGAGLFVLKRFDDAFRNGDKIHGVIRAVGLSNDLEGSLLAPSSEGQLRAMRSAYETAGWEPSGVDLIECHATGTPLGDSVEFESLKFLWGKEGWRPGQAVIGSVKSNVGHLLTAAGAAGLMKTLLAFKNKTLPPTAGFESPSPRIALEGSPFRVLKEAQPWKSRAPRRAAVSGFGFGGINAHLLVEEYAPVRRPARRVKAVGRPPRSGGVPIAVVGLGAHFGPWDGAGKFEERIFGGAAIAPTEKKIGEDAVTRGHFLRSLKVPAGKLRIPPNELRSLLPQQLLMLKTALEAAEDADWSREAQVRAGVFIGIALDLKTTDFYCRWQIEKSAPAWARARGISEREIPDWTARLKDAFGPPLTAERTLGALGGVVASRVARELRAGGAGFTLQSEESSGLKAVEAAFRALQNGGIDIALAGAVDFAGDPRVLCARESGGAIPGEGAAAVVLKRLEDAKMDGDKIYAVLRGMGSASGDAKDPGVLAESARRAFEDSGAPGSGAEEISGVQNQIGDAGAASAMAAFAKAVLCLDREMKDAGGIPTYWIRNKNAGPRRALVSATSVGGSCTHAVLEEFEGGRSLEKKPARIPVGERLFACRGKSAEELIARVQKKQEGGEGPYSCAAVWEGEDELSRQLEKVVNQARRAPGQALGAPGEKVLYRPSTLEKGFKTAFVFPGAGNAYAGMGRALAARWPAALRRQDGENGFLADQYRSGVFWSDRKSASAWTPADVIFGQVSLGTLCSDIVRSFSVEPDAAIGLSLGESAALFALRAWNERDEMLRRMQSSSLFSEDLAGSLRSVRTAWSLASSEKAEWLVGVFSLSDQEARALLKDRPRVRLLIVNSPGECVIGGLREEVIRFAQESGAQYFEVPGVVSVHCDAARPVEREYRRLHLFDVTAPEGISFYSGASGGAYRPTRESAADSITRQALQTVDFPRIIESAYRDGVRLFLEMGPGASCTRMIRAILGDRPFAAAAVCAADGEPSSMLRALAAAYVSGVSVDLDGASEPGIDSAAVEAGGIEISIEDEGFLPFENGVPKTEPSVAIARSAPIRHSPVLEEILAGQAKTAAAHAAYMSFAKTMRETILAAAVREKPTASPRALSREQCLAFAVGRAGDVLGSSYSFADAHPTRVRLPDEPLMLVDRILDIEGVPHSLSSGRVVTEHDVRAGSWYLDGGRIPVCIAVEAGQADLFLSGFLGIDAVTKGRAVYRLLDAVVRFHAPLPEPGSVIRYDIAIDSFFRQGDTHLFRFRFEATCGGQLLLTMQDGCAGFFTQEELDGGKGIVHTALDRRPVVGKKTGGWSALAPLAGFETYSRDKVEALRRGDLAGCFGAAFSGLGLRRAAGLPGGRMSLIDRVTGFEPGGGRFGLGKIRAEADIDPLAWFLTCHFIDDQVMPGTLMYECCLHAFRVLLSRLGWVGEEGSFVYEPVPGISSRLKCRGQVTANTKTAAYEISLKEIGYEEDGTPYALADALMFADGRPVVEMLDMSLRLSGLKKAALEKIWSSARSAAKPQTIFDDASITAFAVGRPSEAFGAPYEIFDKDRVIARLPGPPYKFLERISSIENCEPFVMKAGARIEAEYSVPESGWYFEADRQPFMPFAVLLEAALQPCGWLAAYLGSALTSKEDLSFRNLGGSALQHRPVTLGMGILKTTVTMTGVSSSGGMIIQHYSYSVSCGGVLVYEGTTYFGFFTKAALADQVGLRGAAPYRLSAAEKMRAEAFELPRESPFPDERWRMVDRVTAFVADGGPHGLGAIEGEISVDPNAWFFRAHFYQDPVWPGSLGLESFLQLLKAAAVRRWRVGAGARFESLASGTRHSWEYRGQILPSDAKVRVSAVVTAVDDSSRTLTADGFLEVDGRIIYKMTGFALRML